MDLAIDLLMPIVNAIVEAGGWMRAELFFDARDVVGGILTIR
jgi:hypothetical protein